MDDCPEREGHARGPGEIYAGAKEGGISMKTKPFLLLFALLCGASTAFGQFDFSKLTKVLDTAKDAGKALKGTVIHIGPEEEAAIGDPVAMEVIGKYGGLMRDAAIMK